MFTLVPRAAVRRPVYTPAPSDDAGAHGRSDADCLFCKIVAGDIPADVVHETEHDGRVPRPRAAGADPRAGGPAQPLRRTPPTLAAGEPGPSWSTWSTPPRAVAEQEGLGEGYRLVFNTGAGRPPDRVPRPPARARRPLDGLAAGMSRRAACVPAAAALALALAARRLRAAPRRRTPAAAADAAAVAAPTATPTADAAADHGRRRRSRSRCARASSRVTLAMPDGVHAVGALRHRHRRLPLLPARPAPDAGRLHHRHQHPARQPRRRAPRDPVPGAARRRSPAAEAKDAADAGRGLDLLRRHRPRTQRRAASTTRPGWAPGRRAAREQVHGQGRRRAAGARARG